MHGKQLGDPALAARAILEIADSPAPPLHLLLGSDALERATSCARHRRGRPLRASGLEHPTLGDTKAFACDDDERSRRAA